MHNPTIAAMGLNWNYLAFDVHPDDLEPVLRGSQRMGFIGLNLTVPHKILAHDIVDHLDESGRKWGAVNTIRFECQDDDGIWVPSWKVENLEKRSTRMAGFNTDADAVVRAIREELDLPLSGKSVLLLGAGGAGRVAALKCAEENVGQLFLVNRTLKKCEEVKKEIQDLYPHVQVEIGYPPKNQAMDLILNATSLGLKESDPLPLNTDSVVLSQFQYAYDMIYQPAETRFLSLCKKAGCQTTNGLGMLLYQGVKALEIWTEMKVPDSVMRNALNQHVYGKE